MNPAIIIPTYVRARAASLDAGVLQTYDHATPLGARGELGRCLDSLQNVLGVGQIVVLVACADDIAERAESQVHAICRQFPTLHTAVFGRAENELVQQRMSQLGLGTMYDEVGLGSYGAIKNFGLVVAHVLGFDSVVFIDDDEIIDDPDFLVKAMYGLGKMTRNGVPILAKSGYYLNSQGSYKSSRKSSWADRNWPQTELFNEWIERAMAGKRLSRSNHTCGGCLALSEEAYKRVAFDPYISRGEDLDYLLNLRMYGSDMWFDNQLYLRHNPPRTGNRALRFRQDVYRWTYEYRKMEFSRTQIDLLQLKPSSLEPYPGPFLDASVIKRLKKTARSRMLTESDKSSYGEALRAANGEADVYAQNQCGRYFQLQFVWPETMLQLKGDAILRAALVQSVSQRSVAAKSAQAGLAEEEQAPVELPKRTRRVPRRDERPRMRSIEEESAAAAAERAAALAAASQAEAIIAAAASGAQEADEEVAAQAQRSFEKDGYDGGFDPGATSEIRLNIADYYDAN